MIPAEQAALWKNNDAPALTGNWRLLRYLLRKHPVLRYGALMLGLIVVLAIIAPVIAPYGPQQSNTKDAFEAPSWRHLFGTDRTGVDWFSRTVYAARLDLVIALGSTALAAIFGIPVGAVLGYLGGRWDNFLMRFLEVMQSFPPLVLAMAIVAALKQGPLIVIVVIAFIAFPYYVRLVRAEILSRRRSQFVEAAEAVGASHARIVFMHLLPNSLTSALVYSSLNAGYAIIVTATLGFLGLGIGPGDAEWGLMVQEGAGGVVTGEWWLSFFPGLFIAATVGAFYMLGDGIRDALDPRMRT